MHRRQQGHLHLKDRRPVYSPIARSGQSNKLCSGCGWHQGVCKDTNQQKSHRKVNNNNIWLLNYSQDLAQGVRAFCLFFDHGTPEGPLLLPHDVDVELTTGYSISTPTKQGWKPEFTEGFSEHGNTTDMLVIGNENLLGQILMGNSLSLELTLPNTEKPVSEELRDGLFSFRCQWKFLCRNNARINRTGKICQQSRPGDVTQEKATVK